MHHKIELQKKTACQICDLDIFTVFQILLLNAHPCGVLLGKKRAWIPDEKEAYIEIEIKELSGDKVIVETKDGKVTSHEKILMDTHHHSPPPHVRPHPCRP